MKTHRFIGSAFVAVLIFCPNAYAAIIVSQSFETSGGTWSFSANPVTYNTESTGDPLEVNGSEDVWATISEFTGDIDSGSNGDRFWGIQDLDNTNGGGSMDHVLSFENQDTTGLSGVSVSFDYNAVDWESTDSMRYILYLDDSPQAEVDLTVGGVGGSSTSGWTTETIAIPDSTNTVRLDLIASQNGDDYGGWDFVRLEASAVPEPSSIALFSLGCLSLILQHRRKRHSALTL